MKSVNLKNIQTAMFALARFVDFPEWKADECELTLCLDFSDENKVSLHLQIPGAQSVEVSLPPGSTNEELMIALSNELIDISEQFIEDSRNDFKDNIKSKLSDVKDLLNIKDSDFSANWRSDVEHAISMLRKIENENEDEDNNIQTITMLITALKNACNESNNQSVPSSQSMFVDSI